MSDNLKVAKECGALVRYQLTSALGKVPAEVIFNVSELDDYTSRSLASQQAAHEAEIARLKEENQRVKTDSIVAVETLKADLAAANAACTMRDEALKEIAGLINRTASPERFAQVLQKIASEAISASPQQVSECERKQLEPLRAQVALLVTALNAAWSEDFHLHHHYCAQLRDKALSNSQATAQAYEQEVEARGAVKALEEAALKWLPNMRRSDFESSMGKSVHNMAVDDCVKHVLSMADSIRATSKKAG